MNAGDERAEPEDSADGVVLVTVRYWASARSVAGRTEDRVAGATVADVLSRVMDLHATEPRFARVLSVSSFLVGDQPLGMRDPGTVAVRGGDVVEVLPPFAGG